MERPKLSLGKVIAVLVPICFLLPIALAENYIPMGEEYYENDIDAAIREAQRNDRKGNYQNKYWYNRTTSKSFQLPDLPANDLEKARLEGALGPTAAGEAVSQSNDEDENAILLLEDLKRLGDKDNTQEPNSRPRSEPTKPSSTTFQGIRVEFPRGEVVTTEGVTTSGTVTSTPRP